MKKQIGTIALAVLMIAGAMAIFPGETQVYSNDIGMDNLVYTIIGNSSPVNLTIQINATNIIVTIPGDATPDDFSIVFIEKETNTIIKTIRSGGGGTRTKYVDRNITVFQPEYIDRNITTTETITEEVEKLVYQDTGYKTWMLVFALILGTVFGLLIMRKKKEEDPYNAEEELSKHIEGEEEEQ
jgi:hypothetical protein